MGIIGNNYESMYEFLLDFCRVKSVVGSPSGENEAAEFMYGRLSRLDYFKRKPKNIWFDTLESDPMGRKNFCAFVEAGKKTPKTVVFIGHIDVVSTDVCGEFSELAFEPEKYTEKMKDIDIPQDVRADLNAGGWLFGRGVSDMKSGLTVLTGIFAEMSENASNLECNYLLLGLADEENNGFGVHQAVKMMAGMKKEYGLDFICCIDAEPTITSEKKDIARVYLGTIGCATPFTLCIGKESHVGEYFEGVNGALIASHLNMLAEGDPDTSDEWKGVWYSPQTCLKLQELRQGYSVTLPERVILCYNVLMVARTPEEILAYFAEKAETALNRAIDQVKDRRDRLFEKGAVMLPEISYDYEVMYYSKLIDIVEKVTGRKHEDIAAEVFSSLDPASDSQDRGIALINKYIDLAGIDGLKVIIGFLSPYCQSRVNDRQTPYELAMIKSVEQVKEWFEKNYRKPLAISEVYEGISDMSELGFQESREELDFLTSNLVGYKTDINTPFESMMELDIPVINMGPIGKDAHKMTERVYLPYAFKVLPEQIKTFLNFYLRNIEE